jgi:hypothetical protein
LCHGGNYGEGTLDDAATVIPIRCGRLRHFRRRIKRHESDQRGQIGRSASLSRCADRSIDRIVSSLGTRERRQREDVRLVKARHRTYRTDRQLVAGERAGLVGAQNVHASRPSHPN